MSAVQLSRRLRPFAWGRSVLALLAMVVWWGPWTSTDNTVARAGGAKAGLNVQTGLDLYPQGKRVPAPKLEGTTLDGQPFALADLTGKIVVINVWGSWCAPCRAETPDLVRVANADASRDMAFVGIDTRDNDASAKAFVRNFKVPYPSVKDNNGEVLLAFQGTIPTSVVPTTVVVDRQGQIAARVIGPVTYTTLKGLLDDEIAASKASR